MNLSVKIIPKKAIVANKLFRYIVNFQAIETGIQVSYYEQESLLQPSAKLIPSNDTYWKLGLAVCQRLVEEMEGEMSFYRLEETLGLIVAFAMPVYDCDRIS